MQQLKSRIEAVLFVTAKALSVDEIAAYLDVEPEQVEEAVLELILTIPLVTVRWKLMMKTDISFR